MGMDWLGSLDCYRSCFLTRLNFQRKYFYVAGIIPAIYFLAIYLLTTI